MIRKHPASAHRGKRFAAVRRTRTLLIALLAAIGWTLGAQAADTLSLHDALVLAETQAPQLRAQDAALRAAADEAIRAPQLPDPKLVAGVENLPLDTADRFSLTRDFMTMRKIGVMQEFPRREKRRLRGELAEADVRKEESELQRQRLDVRRETAGAWIERYLAEQTLTLLRELREPADLTVTAAQAALKGGKGSGANVLAAQADRLQLADRLDAAERDVALATAALARWIGPDAAARPLGAAPDFEALPASPDALLSQVGDQAALRPYAALETRAETDVALARAEKKPDWSVEVDYAQRGPAYSNMLSVEFRIDLPLFAAHRQDPAIRAKLAELDRVRAEHDDALRMRREQTEKSLASWAAARKRIARLQDELLPLTGARAEAALAAYRGGADLQSVIAARTAQIDARNSYIAQLGELARAWASLNYLVADKESP